jgi:hypothetical protein
MHTWTAGVSRRAPLPPLEGRGRGWGEARLLANYSQLNYLPQMRLALAYLITQDWRAALAVGLIEPAVQTIAFLLHDRAWAKLDARRRA